MSALLASLAAFPLWAALASLPPPVRQGVGQVVQGTASCVAGDPYAAVKVDVDARRIELCAGGDVAQQIRFGAFLIHDAQAGWSRQPAWRRLNGWTRGSLPPWRWSAGNRAALAFAAPSGQQSPAHDLASFAAAFVDERTRGGDALVCRLLPQARFLHAALTGAPGLPAALVSPPACAAYQAWAAPQGLQRIEVVLATPSTVTMASMFGHVFLRLVGTQPSLDDRTLAFLVESARPIEEERFYALKGITGLYQATLVERSFLETYRTYVVHEGRDLRRFQLNLAPGEREALLARLWSLRQAGRFDYYFFSTNCATLLVDVINSVLPEDRAIAAPMALATTPAGTLEGYAFARAAGAAVDVPLVTFIPDTTFSHAHEAQRAVVDRAAVRGALARSLPQLAWRDDAGEAEARVRLYRGLAALLRAGGGPGQQQTDLQRYLRASAVIEAHLSSVANQAAEASEAGERRSRLHTTLAALRARLAQIPREAEACAPSLRAVLAQTAADDQAQRLRGYQGVGRLLADACAASLADELRRLVLLATEVHADADALAPGLRDQLLFPDRDRLLGEQDYAAGMAPLIDDPYVTRVSPALRAVQEARNALAAPYPRALLAQEAQAHRAAEAGLHARAVPRTGIDELEVGAGAGRAGGPGGPSWQGLLVLAGAMHDERLGDQRRFGFAAHTGLTVLRSELALARTSRGVAVAAYDTRLLGYRSLRPAPVLAGGWLSALGGELYLDLDGRPASARPLGVRLGGGALWPLLTTPSLEHHLLLGAGPVATFDQVVGGDRAGLGASAALEARLGLSSVVPGAAAGAFALARAELRPVWTTRGAAQALAAGTELRWPLWSAMPWPTGGPARGLSLRLAAALESWQTRDAATFDARTTLALAIE